mmetsp:Transcript_40456/g.114566  ORF Transcript_40456/g.114566 Transcript_40456/m.114566 type:complete len:217 (+) Transcript_40456:2113-2763(+)
MELHVGVYLLGGLQGHVVGSKASIHCRCVDLQGVGDAIALGLLVHLHGQLWPLRHPARCDERHVRDVVGSPALRLHGLQDLKGPVQLAGVRRHVDQRIPHGHVNLHPSRHAIRKDLIGPLHEDKLPPPVTPAADILWHPDHLACAGVNECGDDHLARLHSILSHLPIQQEGLFGILGSCCGPDEVRVVLHVQLQAGGLHDAGCLESVWEVGVLRTH